ncbi:hypothetical protein ASPFODRAFT_704262, partial [Aspergillus luchuensis CBS 106.47]
LSVNKVWVDRGYHQGPDSLIGADGKRGGWGWSGRAVIDSQLRWRLMLLCRLICERCRVMACPGIVLIAYSIMVDSPEPISGADGAVMRPHERPGDCPIGHNGDDGPEMEQQQKRGGWTKKTISPTFRWSTRSRSCPHGR